MSPDRCASCNALAPRPTPAETVSAYRARTGWILHGPTCPSCAPSVAPTLAAPARRALLECARELAAQPGALPVWAQILRALGESPPHPVRLVSGARRP